MIFDRLKKATIVTFLISLASCGSFQLQSPDGQIFCECKDQEPDPPVEVTQPDDKSGGETLVIGTLRASQEECTSPCSVILSVEDVLDTTSDNPFSETGVYWDYGDEKADDRDGKIQKGGSYFRAIRGEEEFKEFTDGSSRTHDTNSPIGMHTYTCEEKECVFYPGVAVMNKNGDWATKWTKVVVHGQDATFPGEQTVCVSSAGDWSGCPDGSRQAQRLPVLGQWESDTRYLLHRGESFAADCMQYDIKNIVLSSYGDSEASKPELTGILEIGRDRACNDPLPPSTDFDNEYWVSDIIVEDLRLDGVDMGVTYRNITFKDLDMDFESASRGGFIRASSADVCTRQSTLYDCDDIPTPYGVYISDSKLIGARSRPPGMNVEFLSSTCVSFFGIMASEMQVAFEHNIRVECASRVIVQHNDVNGDHIGNRGRKNAITIRPEGTSPDDMLEQQKRSTSDKSVQYENKYVVIKDNYLGKDGIVDSNAARISLKPTNRSQPETTSFALVTENVFDVPQSGIPTQDVHVAGRKIVCRTDNAYQTSRQCADDGQNRIPSSGYEPADLAQNPPKVPLPPKEY